MAQSFALFSDHLPVSPDISNAFVTSRCATQSVDHIDGHKCSCCQQGRGWGQLKLVTETKASFSEQELLRYLTLSTLAHVVKSPAGRNLSMPANVETPFYRRVGLDGL